MPKNYQHGEKLKTKFMRRQIQICKMKCQSGAIRAVENVETLSVLLRQQSTLTLFTYF